MTRPCYGNSVDDHGAPCGVCGWCEEREPYGPVDEPDDVAETTAAEAVAQAAA